MAYDRQYIEISWLFFIAGTDETAVTSMKYSGSAGFAAASAGLAFLTNSDLDDLTGAMGTLMATANVQWADYSHLSGIKAAAVGTDGAYVSSPKNRDAVVDRVGANRQVHPQLTIACTNRSGSTFGVANFGRMYLPHCALSLPANQATAAAGAYGEVMSAYKTFVNATTAIITAATGFAIVQPMIMTNKTGSASKPILAVSVDNITDTQQRRRRQLSSVYATDTLI